MPQTTIASWSINSDETVATIAELQPDLLLVSCAPLLRPEIFRQARLGAVNIHRGIAPKYRGENTVFWPLHFGDLDHCGVTLHWIDEGVDTGPIIARGYPAVSRDETEATLLAKCARMSADLVLELLESLAQGHVPTGVRMAATGRNYMRRDRTVWAQLQHAWRLTFRRRNARRRSGPRVEWLDPDRQGSAPETLTGAVSR